MHQLTSSPEAAFAGLVASDASRPFVTYYDEDTGERSELSRRSLANWVAKTHFLLTDELGLGPGDRALVALPAHWIAVPVLLGALTAGLEVVADGASDVAFVVPGTLDVADAPDVYAVDPVRAAVGFGDAAPDGAADYVTSVRPQPDTWTQVRLAGSPTDPCLAGLTRAATMTRAADRAAELGLGPGGRLLTTAAWTSADDWVDDVLSPLAVGGSLVVVAHADDATVERRVVQERATARR